MMWYEEISFEQAKTILGSSWIENLILAEGRAPVRSMAASRAAGAWMANEREAHAAWTAVERHLSSSELT